MTWLQIRLTTGREEAPRLEAVLEEAGALSVTLEDAGDEPLFEPGPGELPIWNETIVTGLFAGDTDSDSLRKAILASVDMRTLHGVVTETLEDQVWERAWMDDFHPMRFGDRLWICPAGQPVPEDAAVRVELDPGLAFGTGTHPTTRLCLEWLAGQELKKRRLLDLGCGSGILSIAALKLGAQHVTAIDHDPQALQATRDNADKNNVLDRLTICRSDELDDEGVDVLVANILAGTLIELEPLIASRLRAGGLIALSGILEDQINAVREAFSANFELQKPRRNGEWLLLYGSRR